MTSLLLVWQNAVPSPYTVTYLPHYRDYWNGKQGNVLAGPPDVLAVFFKEISFLIFAITCVTLMPYQIIWDLALRVLSCPTRLTLSTMPSSCCHRNPRGHPLGNKRLSPWCTQLLLYSTYSLYSPFNVFTVELESKLAKLQATKFHLPLFSETQYSSCQFWYFCKSQACQNVRNVNVKTKCDVVCQSTLLPGIMSCIASFCIPISLM